MKDSMYRAESSMFKYRFISAICLISMFVLFALLFYRLGEIAQIKKQIEKIESLENKTKPTTYENR